MPLSHAIQVLRFELQAANAPASRQLPERLSALYWQELEQVLEEELTANCPANQRWQVPQLLLELPAVATQHLEADLPDLLRQALRTALAQLAATQQLPAATDPGSRELEAVHCFLQHGHLPWHTSAETFSLADALSPTLPWHPALRTLVSHLSRDASMQQRLRWQLSGQQLAQLGAAPTPNPSPVEASSVGSISYPAADVLYLANAGLVLLWPFLATLFERLGYLTNQQFRDEAAQQRATLLLQFLATGTEDVPEYQLPLNKLLCGIDQQRPVPRTLPLTAAEQATGEEVLHAALGRWEALKNTSVAGLRETFLERPGQLEWQPGRVVLTVEAHTVDVLLDRLPWSIALLKLPWMAAPLYVTWR